MASMGRYSLAYLSVAMTAGALIGQATATGEPSSLGPQALIQLEQIYQEKSTRTAAHKKLATPLVYALRELEGEAVMRELPRLQVPFQKDKSSRLEVDLTATVTTALLDAIEQDGGSVVSSFPRYREVRAYLSLAAIGRLAERPDVAHVRPASHPVVWSQPEKKVNTSQGDVAHRTAQARALFGVDGSGVKVGVISDSVEALGALQSSGDLPAVTVLPGQAGSGNSEGTAMLEIVHDLAPGAQLFFATALGGEAAFANNIVALKNQGCKVIVDDVSYFGEGVFQDDIVAQAVTTVAGTGVAYFSSAGNSGNLNSGKAGVWEGNFQSGGSFTFGSLTMGTVHNFGSGVLFNQITTAAPASRPITLQWSDPLGGAGNDYDLCLVDSAASVVLGCSTGIQDGNDDPIEGLVGNQQAGTRIAVVNFNGTQQARFLHVNTHGGRLQSTTSGQTSGHSAAADAFSIAAVDVAKAGGGAFIGGAANPVESFTSDGPRQVFFNANGGAITPGNFLAGGGTVRQKPDLTAADGVATASGSLFNPFFGTSAAAPHAAAIAALMFDRNPAMSLAALRSTLQSNALDIMAVGVDRDSGFGIIDAVKAVDAAGGGSTLCVRDADTACLIGGRFEVEVDWQTGTGTGKAQVMDFGGQRTENDQSVFWWFFGPTNFEMGVKVLQACVPSLGNKYWVFVSGLTDQGWTVRVRDSQTGATKTYMNAPGHLSTTFADTGAFNCP